MIKVSSLINLLKKNNSDFYTGVPDSVLKELSYSLQKKGKKNHIIATSEGSAVSLGIGHYLSTKPVPCIYMQNSGLSNALNPLISIAHEKVYSIPLILIIGWRGSPKIKDEPQHNVKGKITESILKLLNIKYTIIRSSIDLKKFDKQIKIAKKKNTIVACLIEQGTLEKIKNVHKKKHFYKLDKELFLKTLLQTLKKNTKIISSTGYNSRELMYLRDKYQIKDSNDFYMVGGMGHTASVALGYSLFSKKYTVCIDGDGSMLMHLGSIFTIGQESKKNFKYILLNNNSHESVGGQKTNLSKINLERVIKEFKFEKYYLVKNKKELNNKLNLFLISKKRAFLEIKMSSSNENSLLGRPKDFIKIKKNFMK